MVDLEKRAIDVGRLGWDRLYHEKTSLFYDFISDYEPTRRFNHLPTLEELRQQRPNSNGWGTGMEDSTINAGVLLAECCDRYEATQDATLSREAATIFEGLKRCGTTSHAPGFVLRSISPWDGASYFIETSRDQLTHFAHGIWRYYHSPLSSADERTTMRELIVGLCRRLEQYVTRQTDYHFCMEDNRPGLVDKMWHVSPHEAPRLPMIYAVGWELTGDTHWRQLYQSYVHEALEQAAALDVKAYPWCYALFQHQVSMEVLAALANERVELKQAWQQQMVRLAEEVTPYIAKIREYEPADVRQVDMDWRTRPSRDLGSSYGQIPQWPEAMLKQFRPVRELGEGLLIKLLAPSLSLTREELDHLAFGLTEVDYDHAFTYAMHYPPAAYWRMAANEAREAGP